MPRMKNLIGNKYGKLTVLENAVARNKHGQLLALVRCDCGTEKLVVRGDLTSGNTKTCGCSLKLRKNNLKHGLSSHPLYAQWHAMKQRAKSRGDCEVYKEWLTFERFYEWALSSGWEKGLCLCRYRDQGDYAPDNVRWDTVSNNVKEYYKCRSTAKPENAKK